MNDTYRDSLVQAELKSQDDYDKTIVSLSGGALGISVVFVKDIIGETEPTIVWALVTAWAIWAASICAVIGSYFSSRMALRNAILRHDQKKKDKIIDSCSAKLTSFLNAVSGILFVVGIIFFIIFSANNLGEVPMSKDDKNQEKGYTPPPPPPQNKPEPLTEGIIPPPPPPTNTTKES